MSVTIGFELVLCAILVITCGISLAIFMDSGRPSNLYATDQDPVQVAQDNDNGSDDNDKNLEFLF